jgi:hypothetical protein
MEERDHSQKGNVSQVLFIFINSGYVSSLLLWPNPYIIANQ